MAREQAWPPTEHSSSDPAPVVATHADIVPSVAPGGNVNVMLSKIAVASLGPDPPVEGRFTIARAASELARVLERNDNIAAEERPHQLAADALLV